MSDLPEGYVAATPLGGSAMLLVHRDGTRVIASLDTAGTLWLDRSRPGAPTHRAVHEQAADEPRGARGASRSRDDASAAGWVVAPTSGILRGLAVGVGDAVERGALLGVVEAMKMQIELRAPCDGTVESVEAAVDARVERGVRLVRIAARAE